MKYALLVIAALLLLIGGFSVYTGIGIIDVERGWASVIAGTTAVVGGVLTIGVAWLVKTLEQMRDLLQPEAIGPEEMSPSAAARAQLRTPRSPSMPHIELPVSPVASPLASSHASSLPSSLSWPPHTVASEEEPAYAEADAEDNEFAESFRDAFARQRDTFAEDNFAQDSFAQDRFAQDRFAQDSFARDAFGKERVEPAASSLAAFSKDSFAKKPFAAEPKEPASSGSAGKRRERMPTSEAKPSSSSSIRDMWQRVGKEPETPFSAARPVLSNGPAENPAKRPVKTSALGETPSVVPLHPVVAEPPAASAKPVQEVAPEPDEPKEDWLETAFAELDSAIAQTPFTPSSGVDEAETVKPAQEEELPPLAAEPEGAEQAAADEPSVIGRYEAEGTSYIMFSDGSIEAQSERGVARFGSMAELKAYFETQEAP